MAQRRISLKKVKEALRLHCNCNLSLRKTAQALGVSRTVISEYIEKCKAHDITWEKAQKMKDEELSLCFANNKIEDPRLTYLNSKCAEYAKELSRVGVTRQLLWEEYKLQNPDGYGYSQFCYYIHQWNDSQEISMRIDHKAGDKLYVDYTGKTIDIVDKITGEIKKTEIFVATLGASKLIYAEAVWSQKKEDFISAQVNALKYIGGVPKAIVPDCLKSAVTKAHKYEPDINPEYSDFASHYGTTIIAARPYKPKDKALVEGSVKIVYQRIFAPLRDQVFHSLEELNMEIKKQLEEVNNRPMQIYKISRWEMWEQIDKEALLPLPVNDYTIRHFARCKAFSNYHIYLAQDQNYYSIPYHYRNKHVDVWYSSNIVEIYHNNRRIALHRRNYTNFHYTTSKEHMPPNHRFVKNWDGEKFISSAEKIGVNTTELIRKILSSKKHPELGYKVCVGILKLEKEFGGDRLDKACKRALYYDSLSLKMIRNILNNRLEEVNDEVENDIDFEIQNHNNIRGPQYYNGGVQ